MTRTSISGLKTQSKILSPEDPPHLPIFQDFVNVPLVVDCNEQPSRAAVHQTEFLTGQTHSRGVHQRHQLLHVVADQAIEQSFVAILDK
jgi:hypothetical protein